MEINYGLLIIHRAHIDELIHQDQIEHSVWFEDEPDWKHAKEELIQELTEDPEFELKHDVKEYVFFKSTDEIRDHYREVMKDVKDD